jgi:ribonuclease HII
MGIIGVDEVGRGVRLLQDISGLKDSKVLSKIRRQTLALEIRRHAEVGLGWASAAEVDAYGLSRALGLAMERSLVQFDPADAVLLDGSFNYLPSRSNISLKIKADASEPAVAAASIVAKVARDTLMALMSRSHPLYGFERHVGYGTALHQAMLTEHGQCSLHRRSFTPVSQLAML